MHSDASTTGDSGRSTSGPADPRPHRWTSFRQSVSLPGHWTRNLVLVIVGLIALGFLSQVFRILQVDFRGLHSLERYFFYDLEGNIPTWFSSILLFLCAERVAGGLGRREPPVTVGTVTGEGFPSSSLTCPSMSWSSSTNRLWCRFVSRCPSVAR